MNTSNYEKIKAQLFLKQGELYQLESAASSQDLAAIEYMGELENEIWKLENDLRREAMNLGIIDQEA